MMKRSKFFKRWRWPVINLDLSRRSHRLKLLLVVLAFFIAGAVVLIGGIQGYEYTESSAFCGTVCHSMDPQWVRYQRSPHSNVRCADCHIGPGASFFVKSKIDGLRQVYAETFDTYDRPIKSPIVNLRPARETCEECHSPSTFKDNIVKTKLHYDNDADNTPIQTTLILKMGGWQESTGKSHGIHWHINSKVYYIAADEQRQVILWIGIEQPDGSLKEYYSRDMLSMAQTAFVEKARENGDVRLMDCIDCHNRTAHYMPTPSESADKAIEDGLISTNLPYMRARAVEVLNQTYQSHAEAYQAIEALAADYSSAANKNNLVANPSYSDNELKSSIDTIKNIYDTTVFPDMSLDWKVNPNNERHTPFLGCFRCHDGNHLLAGSTRGQEQPITGECNLCNTVPINGRGEERLVEAPVIVGPAPASHDDYRWTIEHRSVTQEEELGCYQCHGQGFCNNGACHNLSHPENMLYTHAEEVRQRGGQVCYTCHQDISCTRCHSSDVIQNP